MKDYQLITPPAVEPATVAEALAFMRAYSGAEDALIGTLISAAREYIENLTARAMVTQTWLLQMPAWNETLTRFQAQYAAYYGGLVPASWQPYDSQSQFNVPTVTLDRSPLATVTSVKIYPADGGAQETLIEGTDYSVNDVGTPGSISAFPGTTWPDLALRPDAIQIEFTAGYGATSASVPPMLRLAVLSLAAYWYDQRQPVNVGNITSEMPHTLNAIIQQYRVRGMLA